MSLPNNSGLTWSPNLRTTPPTKTRKRSFGLESKAKQAAIVSTHSFCLWTYPRFGMHHGKQTI